MTINLESVKKCVNRKHGQENSGLVEKVAEILLQSCQDEFLSGISPEEFCDLSAGVLETLSEAVLENPRVKAVNPTASSGGWAQNLTLLEVCLPDRPFLLESIMMGLKRKGIGLNSYIHPVFDLQLDDQKKIVGFVSRHDRETSKSFSYELFLLDRIPDSGSLDQIRRDVIRILRDVTRSTDDYLPMKEKCQEIAERVRSLPQSLPSGKIPEKKKKIEEYARFLEWLDEGNFVFLGYRDYLFLRDGEEIASIKVNPGSGLGILADEKESKYFTPLPVSELAPELRERLEAEPILQVTKTNAASTVHRPPRMDYIGIKHYDREGRVTGEQRFQGLFTLRAFSASTEKIPLLREKLQEVLKLDRARPHSHDFKQIVNTFNSIPRTDLFWLSSSELHREIRKIMDIQQDSEVKVMFRSDPLHRGYAVMVVMPRERYNSEIRKRVHAYLEKKLQATRVIFQLALVGDEEASLRIHFFLTSSVPYGDIDIENIYGEINKLSMHWDDYLREKLFEEIGPEGELLANRYITLLPEGYKAEIPYQQAARDIRNLEKLNRNRLILEMDNPEPSADAKPSTHLTIYHLDSDYSLGRIFPVLRNMGLEVLEQISYQIPTRGKTNTIDIFRILGPDGKIVDLPKDGERLREAIQEVLKDKITSDHLNSLVLTAGLTARQVFLMQAYRGHVFQLKPATSLSFISSTLLAFPECCRALVECFEARFNPAPAKTRDQRIKKAESIFQAEIDKVTSLPQDELLRFIHNLISETQRTNYYLDRDYLSFKVASKNLAGIPEPKPFREIFVFSPDLEAVHLRGGRVARGGLRWSDRPDDFRTEILGLVKTQVTKNALIVPTGSKGGFVLKSTPQDRQHLKQWVMQQYRTFIRGILDLTDNIVDGKTVIAQGLVVYDEPDPYLVVAADKGTATFSDLANSISEEYNFWLGDAFASGGSQGYDHKKEGITAKGAWECVTRHFREMGVDVHKDEFTVAGIGDMSGDVFGNGMIYTDKIRLQAAFNHRHIFLDPVPDAAEGFSERIRLFKDPSLGWGDYDTSKISKGGGVYERESKSIRLSPQLQSMLETDQKEMSGQELIKNILRMKVDLLWNGGIGTYVRSSTEHDSDVGDSANNAVRIDASELRARVIGEGGNLGLTQKARIEYSLNGGKINTDALDNSGGVDMSDHEVNIKILLQPMVNRGKLDIDERNTLLRKMTDSVSKLVLRNNYTQSLCLTLAETQGVEGLETLESLMQYLASNGDLNPRVEFLPTSKELALRKSNRQGFSRPELAILLGYTKIGLKQSVLASDIPEAGIFQHHLFDYFPKALANRFKGDLASHPLKNEIITTQLTNIAADRLGLTFFHKLIRDTGAHPIEAIRVVLCVVEILELPRLWEKVFALDGKIDIDSQYRIMEEISSAVEAVSQWILLSDCDTRNLDLFLSAYKPGIETMKSNVPDYLYVNSLQDSFQARFGKLVDSGIPEDLSRDLATLTYLPSFMGIIDTVTSTGISTRKAARYFYEIGEVLSMGWFREQLVKIPASNEWDSVALAGLITDLRGLQRKLTLQYLEDRRFPGITADDFLRTNARDLDRYLQVLQKLRIGEEIEISGASVAVRMLNQLSSNIKD